MTPEGATLYIAGFGVLAEVSNPGTGSAKWTDYLSVGSAKVGMRTLQVASGTLTTRYFHTDHLGSISVLTNENGVVVERLSYDAWGKRRNPDGSDDTAGSITSQTTQGFTGQEELSVAGLVHLNGRVYDPLLARFTSADTITESPFSTQGWNRYSYVGNDPLKYTDPSGHCFLGCFWEHVGHAVTSIFSNSIVKAVTQIVLNVALNIVLPGASIAVAAVSAAIVTGLAGGNLSQMLRAGVVAGATAGAFYLVGTATNAVAGQGFDLAAEHIHPEFGTNEYAFNVAGHALVGCGASVAQGGSCQSGAMAGAVSAAAAPAMGGMSGAQRLVASAVLGGAASVAGGGKFANGAITGAFGYMFNACGADPNGCMKWGASIGTGLGIAASAGCDLGTVGACALANPAIVAGMGAAGAATGAAADAASGAIDNYIHANSMDSQRQTYVYQLVNPAGDVLKYGVTSELNPQGRYSTSEYAAMNAQMQVLGAYPTRLMGRVEELRLNGNYVIQNGSFPPLTFRW